MMVPTIQYWVLALAVAATLVSSARMKAAPRPIEKRNE
jgi:hypothetical protein